MSRFDKYEPRVGGFRAKLEAAIAGTPAGSSGGETGDVGVLQAVSLNASGRVAIGGAAATDLVGLICPVRPMAAGEAIDVMTAGEIADATMSAGTAFVAGARVYGHIDGSVDSTATAGALLGRTVELTRLVVRTALA